MSGASGSWFESEELLVAELRRGAGTRVAPEIPGYEGLAEVARGGQGVVYVATQRSTRRRVAIKVIPESAGSPESRRRFEREIDLVASLRHPGIVSVYDSGVTDQGRPFLVMEFIEGRPVDEAIGLGREGSIDRARIRAALGTFVQVCEAVHYAHQRGVIHRDLKPSNIRVDADGRARILDFGLAKAIGPSDAVSIAGRATALSIEGQFMGSLPWASPEQASGTPDAVDVRTDVYALGVVLYQVLTGAFPYVVAGGLKATLDNIIAAEPIAPRSLRPELDDELSTILGKALAKAPDRRYQSPGELGADLRRYLAGEPIAAKRDSAWYTVRKAVRRYRIAAVAGALVTAATAGALVVSLRALGETRIERDRAERQTAAARAVTEFLGEMLMAADPGSRGKDLKLVEFLEPAGRNAAARFAGQPESLVAIRSYLATAYRNLQLYDQSLEQARQGLAVAEQHLASTSDEFLALRTSLASTLLDLEQLDEARAQAERAVADAVAMRGPGTRLHAEALSVLASINHRGGGLALAERQRRELVEMMTRLFSADSSETLGALGNLGSTLYALGRYPEAIAVLEDAIDRARRSLGPDHIAALAPLSALLSAYAHTGQREKALPLLKDAWERMSARYGPESANALTYANNYAVALHNSGRSAEALPIVERVVAGFTQVFGPDHVNVLRALTVLGSIHGAMGSKEREIEVQKQALDIADRTLGPKHQVWHYLINNYAQALGAAGRHAESIAAYERSMATVDEVFGSDHSMPSTIWFNLAVVKRHAGHPASETAPLLERASERFLATLGAESDWTTDCVKELVGTLEQAGRSTEAQKWRDRLQAASAAP